MPESSPSAGPRRPAAHALAASRDVVDVAAIVDDVVDGTGTAREAPPRGTRRARRASTRAPATARTTAAAAFVSSGPFPLVGSGPGADRGSRRGRARCVPTGDARVVPGPGERRAKRGARRAPALRAAPRGVFSVSAEARASAEAKLRRSRDGLHGGILSSAGARGGFESPAGTSRGATDAGRDSSATRTSRAPRGLDCSVHRRAKGALGDCRITVIDGASSLAHRPLYRRTRDDSDDSILFPKSACCTVCVPGIGTLSPFGALAFLGDENCTAQDPVRPLSPAQSTRVRLVEFKMDQIKL